MSDKKFSKQEIVIGAVASVTTVFVLGPWGLLVSALSGLLWVLGGTYLKAIRRWGVPALQLAATIALRGFSVQAALVAAIGVALLHIGDGFPDRRPTTQDAGSWLGRLVECFILDPEVGGPVTKWLVAAIYQLRWLGCIWK